MKQTHRVKALEGSNQANKWGKPHRIICRIGQSVDGAKAEYGLDKIAPGDVVIVRTFVDHHRAGSAGPPPPVLNINW